MARRSAGRASAYPTDEWHDTQDVFASPVRSLVALANHMSIRSSRYVAAAARSHPAALTAVAWAPPGALAFWPAARRTPAAITSRRMVVARLIMSGSLAGPAYTQS